jgi:hypothetical protein
MNNLNDAIAELKLNCQASTTLMLVNAMNANQISLGALMVFDEIADYPLETAVDEKERTALVADLLRKSLNFAALERVE